MALVDREVGVAVAATAAVISPRAREVMRRGAVYGLAGVLKVGEVVAGTARGAARGAQAGVLGLSGEGAEEPAPRSSSQRSSGAKSEGSRARSSGSGQKAGAST